MAKRKYSRKRRNTFVPYAMTALGIMALVLIVALVIGETLNRRDVPATSNLAINSTSQDDDYALQMQPTPSPEPTVEPTVVPTVEPTVEPTAAGVPESFSDIVGHKSFQYLPVIKRGETDEKKIAITVDDCYQLENLKAISATAYQNGGKLTLFPIGENVMRKGMPEVLKACVFDMGFEIENHTWSHARVFRLSEEEMAQEIWKQRTAVSYALGVDYEQHFFRLMGGDGENDQRTHNYLNQLGYLGIADWSISGSDATMDQIKGALKPGAIFLFHTTNGDKDKLLEFIPYAVSQGYKLVTLNELLGYEANAVSDSSGKDYSMPQPQAYTVEYREQKKGDYSWAVVRIQEKLTELGYLGSQSKSATKGSPADGVYGESTVAAIQAFQASVGLPTTGVADVETQRYLLGEPV